MLIYGNQAMTSHQYSIWTKDVVWEQRYGLLCKFCEHFSSKAQAIAVRLLYWGRGFKVIETVHITPMGPMVMVLMAKTRFPPPPSTSASLDPEVYLSGHITLCLYIPSTGK